MRLSFFGKYYSNFFSSKNITDARFQAFVRFLIESLTLNNPSGVFDADIAALTAAYTAFFGNYLTKGVDAADSASATISIDEATQLFIDGVRKNYKQLLRCIRRGRLSINNFFQKDSPSLVDSQELMYNHQVIGWLQKQISIRQPLAEPLLLPCLRVMKQVLPLRSQDKTLAKVP